GWYLLDRLGSVRDIENYAGTTQLDHLDYSGFGAVIYELDSTRSDRYLYTGREYNSETGLQYNRARYYDSGTGRWISQDPLGFKAGDRNLYRYVGNSPTNAMDPSGKIVPLIVGGIIAGALLLGAAGYIGYQSYQSTGNAFDRRVWGESWQGIKDGLAMVANA